MKILHVLAQLPGKTGSGVYFSNMIQGFKTYEHEQKALFAVQDEYDWNVLVKEDQYPVNFKSDLLPFPIVGMSDVMPYENTTYSSMTKPMIHKWLRAYKDQLILIKQSFKPDIIFAHHLWMLSSLVREVFPHTKIIGICHNTDLRQAKLNPELRREYVRNIHELDYIFSASHEQNSEIVEEYGGNIEKIIPVGGGFNQNIFYFPEEKPDNEIIKLVYCGKIDPSKGIYELIEVYKTLKLSDITLDIIGNPDEINKKKLEEYTHEDKSISLYNVVDQIQLGHTLREKHIFLMPSFYEGLGLMAIESLACGLYVVTTEIEALMALLGEEIKDSGVIKYVPLPRIYDTDKPVSEDLPRFKEHLKQAILLQIHKVRNNISVPEEIEAEIKLFSWEGLVHRMNNIIYSIVGE